MVEFIDGHYAMFQPDRAGGTGRCVFQSDGGIQGQDEVFRNKKTYAYVNNEKIKAVKQPIFIKNGSYMGPVNKLFKKSSLKVKVTSSENTLTLQYRSNVVVLKNGSRNVTTNGEVSRMLAPAMLVTYPSGKTKWVVPLNSVCSCLGITYKLKNGVIRMKGAANTATTSSSSTTVPETPQQNGQITLVLDAGHGGMDSGATGNGFREKNMTLQILLAPRECLIMTAGSRYIIQEHRIHIRA